MTNTYFLSRIGKEKNPEIEGGKVKDYFKSIKGLDLNKPSNRFVTSLLVVTFLKGHRRPKEIKRLGLKKEEIDEAETAINDART